MTKLMRLTLVCERCQQSADLEFDGWANTSTAAVWACPYCRHRNPVGAFGHVRWVRKVVLGSDVEQT